MMTADINREQLILLAQCVLFGAGAGLCYDVFRAARRVLCPGRAGETACDAPDSGACSCCSGRVPGERCGRAA